MENNKDQNDFAVEEEIDTETVMLQFYRYPEAFLVFIYFLKIISKSELRGELDKSHIWMLAELHF